jgi:apolipoprotein D and lipocalin family protein
MNRSARRYALLGALAVTVAVAANARSGHLSIRPVADFDIDRYLGQWYEIARFPNRFQRRCAGDVSALYQRLPDRTVQVSNRCVTRTGVVDEAEGQARGLEGGVPAQLQVRFAPEWLAWLPVVWADYWVVALDAQYRYAAVSEPRGRYLWILSRTPRLDETAYEALLTELRAMGLETDKLVLTPQS